MSSNQSSFIGGRMINILVFVACAVILVSYRYSSQNVVQRPAYAQENRERPYSSQSSTIESYKPLWNTANDLKNYWLYFRSIVKQTQFLNQTRTIDDGYAAMNSRFLDLMKNSAEERKHQLDEIAKFIRQEIEKQQNPTDCSKTDQILIDISNSGCGFGCTLHSVAGGLLRAFMTNRTFILRSDDWHYANEGWEYAFLPVSRCQLSSTWKNDRRISKIGWGAPSWTHWTVPTELGTSLKKLHGHPFAWWIAQFTAYVFRLQPFMEKQLENLMREIGFTNSAVGIQIRWGDKVGKEADKHEVEEYMIFVERWFQQLERRGKPVDRLVYLATEEKEVWNQMKEKYPKYKFIGNLRSTEVKRVKFRYKHEGLEDVITDIYLLSRCSYLVCTLSSSVCRTAYELMMTIFDDASMRFQSVDALYRLKSSELQPWEAVMDHHPAWPDELALKKGDNVIVNLDPHLPFNDGFLRGKNERTKQEGKFPTFKVREKVPNYNKSKIKGLRKLDMK